jgi:hypothetical protein
MSCEPTFSELAVEWGMTEAELEELFETWNNDPDLDGTSDPKEWSVFGNYGYGYSHDFHFHYPPTPPPTPSLTEIVDNEQTDISEQLKVFTDEEDEFTCIQCKKTLFIYDDECCDKERSNIE